MKVVEKDYAGRDIGPISPDGNTRQPKITDLYLFLQGEIEHCGYDQGRLEDMQDHIDKLSKLLLHLIGFMAETKILPFVGLQEILQQAGFHKIAKVLDDARP